MPRVSRLRALAAAALAATVIVTVQPPAPAAAVTPADRVVKIAMAQRGDPWVYGATGPSAFDCSGLVIYAFRKAGELDAIGNGRYRSGSAMLRWARANGLTTSRGRRGDVVVWGNGSHVGIYLGDGKAISTLVSGVRVHRLRALTAPFTTFVRTGLSGIGAGTARTTPAPVKVLERRVVAVSALNLRSAPRLASSVYRVLGRGTRLAVVRVSRDSAGRTWYRVVAGSRTGWVAGWLTRPAR